MKDILIVDRDNIFKEKYQSNLNLLENSYYKLHFKDYENFWQM